MSVNLPSGSAVPIHGRVPAQASFLTVTRGYPGHTPTVSITTGNTAKVGAIARMIDRLRPARPGVVNCPNIPVAPTVALTFRQGRQGRLVAQASTLATGPKGECPGITFRVPSGADRTLSAQPAFLRRAQRVLGIKLVTG